jgi:hypothetical protein
MKHGVAAGYIEVYVGPNHPMGNSRGYCLEHRLVMSEIIGRPLLRHERPHHINGMRTDNRPENLELWVVSQPSGQRAIELLAWARTLIATYEPIEDRLVA